MKRINSLFLSLVLLPSTLFSQLDTLYSKYNISEKIVPISSRHIIDFDINGDSIADFSKVYFSERDSSGKLTIPEHAHPRYYIFYSNEKGINRINAIIHNKEADTINENKEFLFILPKKKKPKKIIL